MYNETELQLSGKMKIQNLASVSKTPDDYVRHTQTSFERRNLLRPHIECVGTKNEALNNIEDERKMSTLLQDRRTLPSGTNQPLPEMGVPVAAARSDVARESNNSGSSDSGDPDGLDLMVKNMFWDDF